MEVLRVDFSKSFDTLWKRMRMLERNGGEKNKISILIELIAAVIDD